MSEHANTFKIGLFTVVASGLILTGVTVLGAGAYFERTIPIETYLTESVDGLDVGAPVKFRGVRVGRVSSIGFAGAVYKVPPDQRMERGYVRIVVEMKHDQFDLEFASDPEASLARAIESGLRLRLTSSGLVGQTFLEFVFLGDDAGEPMTLSWTPESFYVPSSQSIRGQITSAAERIARQLEEADIAATIKGIGSLAANLDRKVGELDIGTLQKDADQLLKGLRQNSERVQAILSNPAIDEAIAGAGGLKQMPETVEHIRRAAAGIDQIINSDDTKAMIANLGTTMQAAAPATDQLRLLLTRIDRLIAQQQADIEGLLSSLRDAAQNIQELSEDAKENPSRILFGRPPARDAAPTKGGKK